MGSEELADNLFRIVQTESKIKRDNIKGENNANNIHYNMGKNIRNFIKEQGGTMPEELLTPNKSLKEIEKEKNKLVLQKFIY
jgi:DNA-damage-inducible protein D